MTQIASGNSSWSLWERWTTKWPPSSHSQVTRPGTTSSKSRCLASVAHVPISASNGARAGSRSVMSVGPSHGAGLIGPRRGATLRVVLRPFAEVDVFTTEPYRGNPVAVVLDGGGLSDAEMQRFAHWTNLAETTFVLPPASAEADYRVRIFTPGRELPFAGHPTLGTCHAWLEAGGRPRRDDTIVQECGAGLVSIRRTDAGLAFAAPPLVRSGPVD